MNPHRIEDPTALREENEKLLQRNNVLRAVMRKLRWKWWLSLTSTICLFAASVYSMTKGFDHRKAEQRFKEDWAAQLDAAAKRASAAVSADLFQPHISVSFVMTERDTCTQDDRKDDFPCYRVSAALKNESGATDEHPGCRVGIYDGKENKIDEVHLGAHFPLRVGEVTRVVSDWLDTGDEKMPAVLTARVVATDHDGYGFTLITTGGGGGAGGASSGSGSSQ